MNTELIESLKVKIEVLDRQIGALVTDRNGLRQLLAEESTEFKVGDRVKKPNSTTVYQIVRIAPGSYGNTTKFFGSKIKKDGNPGSLVSEIWIGYKENLIYA